MQGSKLVCSIHRVCKLQPPFPLPTTKTENKGKPETAEKRKQEASPRPLLPESRGGRFGGAGAAGLAGGAAAAGEERTAQRDAGAVPGGGEIFLLSLQHLKAMGSQPR